MQTQFPCGYLFCGDFGQVLVQQFADVLVHGGPDLLGGLLGLGGIAVVEGILYHSGVATLQVQGRLLPHHHVLQLQHSVMIENTDYKQHMLNIELEYK